MKLYADSGRRDEACQKFLHLHEHENHPDVYSPRERVVLDYTVKVARDAHLVTDEDFAGIETCLVRAQPRRQDAGSALRRGNGTPYLCPSFGINVAHRTFLPSKTAGSRRFRYRNEGSTRRR